MNMNATVNCQTRPPQQTYEEWTDHNTGFMRIATCVKEAEIFAFSSPPPALTEQFNIVKPSVIDWEIVFANTKSRHNRNILYYTTKVSRIKP